MLGMSENFFCHCPGGTGKRGKTGGNGGKRGGGGLNREIVGSCNGGHGNRMVITVERSWRHPWLHCAWQESDL